MNKTNKHRVPQRAGIGFLFLCLLSASSHLHAAEFEIEVYVRTKPLPNKVVLLGGIGEPKEFDKPKPKNLHTFTTRWALEDEKLLVKIDIRAEWDDGQEYLTLLVPSSLISGTPLGTILYNRPSQISYSYIKKIGDRPQRIDQDLRTYYESRYIARKLKGTNPKSASFILSVYHWVESAYRIAAHHSATYIPMDAEAVKEMKELLEKSRLDRKLHERMFSREHLNINRSGLLKTMMRSYLLEWKYFKYVSLLSSKSKYAEAYSLNEYFLRRYNSIVERSSRTNNNPYLIFLKREWRIDRTILESNRRYFLTRLQNIPPATGTGNGTEVEYIDIVQ